MPQLQDTAAPQRRRLLRILLVRFGEVPTDPTAVRVLSTGLAATGLLRDARDLNSRCFDAEGRKPVAERIDSCWQESGLRERLVLPNPEDGNGSVARVACPDGDDWSRSIS